MFLSTPHLIPWCHTLRPLQVTLPANTENMMKHPFDPFGATFTIYWKYWCSQTCLISLPESALGPVTSAHSFQSRSTAHLKPGGPRFVYDQLWVWHCLNMWQGNLFGRHTQNALAWWSQKPMATVQTDLIWRETVGCSISFSQKSQLEEALARTWVAFAHVSHGGSAKDYSTIRPEMGGVYVTCLASQRQSCNVAKCLGKSDCGWLR